MTTHVTIIGNVTQMGDGKQNQGLRFTPSGAAVFNFNLADNTRVKDPQTGEWGNGPASYYKVTVWRDQAENVAASIGVGTRVAVTGELRIEQYDRKDENGQIIGKGQNAVIHAEDVSVSLRFATAQVTKTPKQAPQGGYGNQGGQQAPQGGYDNQGGQQAPQGGNPWTQPSGGSSYDNPPF